MTSTLSQLTLIFRSVLRDPKLELKPETTAQDVPNWDSRNHVLLLLEIEDHFSIKLPLGEVVASRNVGDLVKMVEAKCSQK